MHSSTRIEHGGPGGAKGCSSSAHDLHNIVHRVRKEPLAQSAHQVLQISAFGAIELRAVCIDEGKGCCAHANGTRNFAAGF